MKNEINMELPIKINAIVIYKNKILVIKRKPEDGGFWQTITGTLKEGETLRDTLIREIKEEVGIPQKNISNISEIVHTFTWLKKGWPQTEYVFVVEVVSNKVTLGNEHTSYVWLEGEKAIKKVKTENNKIAIRKALKWLRQKKVT